MNNVIKFCVPSYDKLASDPEAKGFLRAYIRVMYGSGNDAREVYDSMPDLEKRRVLRDMKDCGIDINDKHRSNSSKFAVSL